MVLLQQLLVDAGAVVVAIDPGAGDHLDEVLVAGKVLGQQDEVPAAVVYGLGGAIGVGDVGLLLEAGAASAVDLAAKDGLEERPSLGRRQLRT